MKVLIANNMAPFIWGGAEELAVNLKQNIELHGHEAEILRVPFQWEPATGIPSQMLMVRALESAEADHVIGLKFPAYLLQHSKKSLWLLHQYRQAYDLFETAQTNLPAGQAGKELREVIRNADNECFAGCRKIFTNSEVTRDRLRTHNGFDAQVLLPPVNDPEAFGGGEMGGYILAAGRVNGMKRQRLLVQALAHTKAPVKLVIAGPPDQPGDADDLRATAERLGITDRVQLDIRFLPRSLYAEYVNKAAAVAYLPFDEDSLGYVAMEAATASKALITTTDSGGILNLVKHEGTGWVSEPEPQALAAALQAVYANTCRTRAYGVAARQLWEGMKVNWPETVERLLQ